MSEVSSFSSSYQLGQRQLCIQKLYIEHYFEVTDPLDAFVRAVPTCLLLLRKHVPTTVYVVDLETSNGLMSVV